MTAIFLSYARGDDFEPFDPATSFLMRLCRDLTAKGFDVWYDRVSMPSRTLSFSQEIRDAIDGCDRLVLVVGPRMAASEYVRHEWQFAYFANEKIVTPILRRGGFSLVPDELKFLHCEDFRDNAQYEFHLANLARILSDPKPALGKLIGVPSLPETGKPGKPGHSEFFLNLLTSLSVWASVQSVDVIVGVGQCAADSSAPRKDKNVRLSVRFFSDSVRRNSQRYAYTILPSTCTPEPGWSYGRSTSQCVHQRDLP